MCSYCGQDTYHVDWDYLVGHNHLSCILAAEQTAEKNADSKLEKNIRRETDGLWC